MKETDGTLTRRKQILAAAAKVFEASGYAQATIDEVASEAGVAKGSIYNYFQSKQDLFVQVFAESFSVDEQQVLEKLDRPASTLVKLGAVVDEWSARFEKYSKEGALVLEFWLSAARQGQGFMTDTFRDMLIRWRKKLTDIIAEGVNNGELRSEVDPPIAAASIMATFDGLILQAILGLGLVVNEEFFNRLKMGILYALAANPSAITEMKEDTDETSE